MDGLLAELVQQADEQIRRGLLVEEHFPQRGDLRAVPAAEQAHPGQGGGVGVPAVGEFFQDVADLLPHAPSGQGTGGNDLHAFVFDLRRFEELFVGDRFEGQQLDEGLGADDHRGVFAETLQQGGCGLFSADAPDHDRAHQAPAAVAAARQGLEQRQQGRVLGAPQTGQHGRQPLVVIEGFNEKGLRSLDGLVRNGRGLCGQGQHG